MNLVEAIRRVREHDDHASLLEAIPYMRTMGITVVDVERTGEHRTLVLEMASGEDHIGNPWLPALHGGVIGAFLENAAIVQLLLDQEDSGTLPKPINVTVDYQRSGRVVPTRAAARVTKLGRRVATVHAGCWQDDRERPIATLAGHFLMK